MATSSTVPSENAAQAYDEKKPQLSYYNVGSRKSKLALVQAEMVVEALAREFPDHIFDIKARDTAAGDIDKVTPFKDMPVKNIWTHELETLLMEGSLDMLSHSLKDVPTQLPPSCEIGGVLARADPRDAFVIKAGRKHCTIADLPAGAVIGTSSIRRTAQVALRYPHLVVKDVRGNLPTRLNKLDAEDGPFDALILAAAGLSRIDLSARISQYLDSKNGNMLYAVGQGAIGIENRFDDERVRAMIDAVNHKDTYLAVNVERSLLGTIEGGCSAPLGVETSWINENSDTKSLRLKAIVVSVDGKIAVEIDQTEVVNSMDEALSFGTKAAHDLLRKGADKILAEINAKKRTTVADLEET